MKKLPSPCIDVCKFRRQGHCIGCSMTKAQKKLFKRLKKPADQAAFLELLAHQQSDLGKYRHWPAAYGRKCRKKGVAAPAVALA
ncbi:MAG: DUF1289 domain-containing protein [Pseudomonadota bacterium]